jgi:regulator of nucleoside diphosphate kinase
MNRIIHITQPDHQRLRELIRSAQASDYRGSPYLESLEAELERAEIMDARQIPGDVITMNSTVRLADIEEGDEMTYTLVYPEDADLAQNKISVLAPIGTAMLGYRVGDTFEWEVPAGKVSMKVKEIIFQPEASGDYNL